MFNSEMCEREIVNAVRNLFRAHIPESNAWAEPNHLSIVSKVFGGLAFSALQEARNGIDTRVLIDSVTGSYLDEIAARPPFSTTRLPAGFAEGCVDVCFPGVASLAIGDTLTREDGQTYSVTCDVTLDAEGCGQVKVRADSDGPSGNAVFGTPFEDPRGDAAVCKDGISGGNEIECDDDLRDRLYSYQRECQFGSIASIEMRALGITGIRYAKACDGMGGTSLYVGTKTGPVPTPSEIADVQAVFDDPCEKSPGVCVTVRGVVECPVDVVIQDNCPAGISAVDIKDYLDIWAADLGAGVGFTQHDIESALSAQYPGEKWVVVSGGFDAAINCVVTIGSVSFQ